MSQWTHILSPAEIEARRALTASLDPAFARSEAEWYASRTDNELRARMRGAWFANEPDGYQMARSHLALRGAAECNPLDSYPVFP